MVLLVAGGEIFEDKEYVGTYVYYGVIPYTLLVKSHGSIINNFLDKNNVSPVFL